MDNEVWDHGFDRLGSLIVNDVLMERVDKLAVFIYIPVDNLPEVQALQYDILDRFKSGIRLVPVEPENLHITLLYLERAKDDKLEEFFNKLTLSLPVSFEVETSHVGTFAEADDKPVVLHISPSPSLLRLQNELFNTAFSMGLPISGFSEPQNFKPHISLATGLKPPDAQIPDLKEPFKITVTRIEATRPEYELIRTIHLPTFRKQDILVEQTDGPGSASELGALGTSIAGIDETDPRIAEMESGVKQEELPISIQILYDPDLGKEAQGVNTQDTFDITLGPSFWEAHDEEKAGILARMYGLELARRMLLGPGGPHEWTRADALMSAPPSEVGLGHRYVFGNNSLTEAMADTYASLSLNFTEVETRDYEDAARWIGYAITQFDEFEPVNVPDFRELAQEIGDMPPFPGVTLIIERGGPGSGFEGHAGRPGEVGGSLPSGAGVGKEINPPRGGTEHFEPGESQQRHQDLTFWTDEQVVEAIREEEVRAERLGIELIHEREEVLERTWELFESSLNEFDKKSYSKEQFIENWTRIITNAGGDPNPRFVLAAMREINDAVEQGWMPVPPIPIVIKLQNPDFDDSAQGTYRANGKTGQGAYIDIFQDRTFQGDERTSISKTNKPLIQWLARDDKVESLSNDVSGVTEYFPNEIGASVLHELGHYWDDNNFKMDQGPDDPQGRALRIFRTDDGRDRLDQLVSFYAAQKPQEAVAESYALYHHPRYDELNDDRKNFIEHILFGDKS